MKEGGTEAPTRHALDWRDPDFYNVEKIDDELRRVFDICHGCRRCFNLCDSFPRLLDLIDDSDSGELDSVSSADFGPIVDACTLCDMCFMTKCPYVPPHEFNLDFPHLMLRYRAAEAKAGKKPFVAGQLAKTDRNGKLARPIAPLANFASSAKNKVTRPMLEAIAGIDAKAELPKYNSRTFMMAQRQSPPERDVTGPAAKRKAVLYATCFVNYNTPDTGVAAAAVLGKNGVEVEAAYPGCCGMPYLEQGDLEKVAAQAAKVAADMKQWIDNGYDVITLTASCGLMFKFEWPLILPEDANVKALAAATFDICEYVVDINKKVGLATGLSPLDGGVSMHMACHARAQNMGPKAAEMLRLIPKTEVDVIERCSGHGGTFGVLKPTHEVAMKVGKPVARTVEKQARAAIASDCPLAAKHILQGVAELGAEPPKTEIGRPYHPIELLARAYGLAQV